jgi:formylmethanofuran dehydrogenase subunit E
MKLTAHELELAKKQAAKYLPENQPAPIPQARRCWRCDEVRQPDEYYDHSANVCKPCKRAETARRKKQKRFFLPEPQ